MKNKIVKNWSILTFSNLLGQGLGMFATIIVARSLLPAEYGYYSLVMIYADMGVIVAALGMKQIIIRELSRHPQYAKQYLKKIARYQFIASIPVVIFILAYSYYTNQSLFELSGASIGLLYSLLVVMVFNSIAFSHEDFVLPSVLNLLERMLWVLLLWIMPHSWLTLSHIAFLYVSVQWLKSLVLMIVVYQKNYIQHTSETAVSNLLKMAAPLYWVELLVIVTDQVPILFLSANSASEQVGFFYASLKLILPVETMIATLMSVIMPGLAKAHGDDVLFRKMITRAIIVIVMIGITVAFVTTILSNEIIYIIFGEKYQTSALVLQYQIWFAVLVAILDFMGTALIASDNQKKLGIISTIAALISLPIMWFSSFYGAQGLATGFLLVGIFNIIYWWPYFQRLHATPFSLKLTLSLSMALSGSFILANYVANTQGVLLRIIIVCVVMMIMAYYLYQMYRNKLGA